MVHFLVGWSASECTESVHSDACVVNNEIETFFAMLLFQVIGECVDAVFVGDVECVEFDLR
jgi:hypothetical protein